MRRFAQTTALAVVCLSAFPAIAQSSPPYVIQGPTIVQDPGCALKQENFGGGALTTKCVSVSYDESQPTSAAIAQNRFMLVPRGNLLFQFPVVSNVPPPTLRGNLTVDFNVGITVTGGNAGEIAQASGDVQFHGKGAAILEVPINVDWGESVVTFQIALKQEIIYGPCDPVAANCVEAAGGFTGPDLSSISLAGVWLSPLPKDAFLLVVTPAAGFQLSLLPTTILYAPLGNGKQAVSKFTVTMITATNQTFTTSAGNTETMNNDDKTQYQFGVTVSFGGSGSSGSNDGTGGSTGVSVNGKFNAGYNYTQSWDHSVETQDQTTFGRTGSIENDQDIYVERDVVPLPGQPSLDNITSADQQPFWNDLFLAVMNPQYAVWDYPAGPVIQPLGNVSVVELPLRQMDHCGNSANAIEPASFAPQQWKAGQSFSVGNVVLDSNNNIQVVTVGGTSSTSVPSWSQSEGGTTSDGSVVWTMQNTQFVKYKGSVAQPNPQFITLNAWAAGQRFSAGALIQGPDSIEVATTAGTSGTTPPTWNTQDESATVDGSVTWTNEQDHLVVYAGPASQGQEVYQWLGSDECAGIASLDQFYVSKAQSATPIAYRIIGGPNVAPPSNANTFGSDMKTIQSSGQTLSRQWTTKVTDVVSNSRSITGGIDLGLNIASVALGLNFNTGGTQTSATTTTYSTVNSETLQSQLTDTREAAVSTTIQDSGGEQSIPANVMQDSIFMGIAVQDPEIHPPFSTSHTASPATNFDAPAQFAGLPVVPVGHSVAILRKNGSSEPSTYLRKTNYGYGIVVKKPATSPDKIEMQLRGAYAEASHRHQTRTLPNPQQATIKFLNNQQTLTMLKGLKTPSQPVLDAIKQLEGSVSPLRP